MNSSHNFNIVVTFVKKIMAHLDEPDASKLNSFLNLFNQSSSKVIFNGTPFNQAMSFIELWSNSIVKTNHLLSLLDFHEIPGTNILVININGKVRFDESGRDKNGRDSIIPLNNTQPTQMNANMANRSIWGPYFGMSLQLVIDSAIFRNNTVGIINSFNYNLIYKPEDSLIKI
ncbi:hypothetical protein TBLA_0I03130 [Henningerozyma blattae CBS 6284]|uniref:NTF2 domain-containing protein n=1 Tax=Henningerozyma blattae (strain ATCC 34711 / CBS 6284 / DSM 70876 / NBRC 10599 / NRRL Y-10934 / UCD 77-7) TaxID=1071380 RepID=I2H9B6_HENB6|nr:hypothetical protein TBLA_0I03130 [Tetrapisispora blattae CBS 6284]CCH62968.1 hypothetical protein TBLA_0I03130 [Tetrapisispora blattae CBS 6284]